MASREQLRSIHYLRGIAALMVVAFHTFSYGMVQDYARDAALWLKQGVAIFFVISGYVMVASAQSKRMTPAAFFWRRFLRIAPLYWLATIMLFAFGLRHADDLPNLPWSLFFLPWFPPGSASNAPPVLDVGWTLLIEMAFYAVFATSMFFPRKWAVPIAAAVLGIASTLQFMAPDNWLVAIYGHPRMLEFVCGMLLAHWRLRLPVIACPVGFAILMLVGSNETPAYHWLCISLPAVLIVGGALGAEERLPRSIVLAALGDASYAIYLFHYLIFHVAVVPLCGYPAPIGGVLPLALILSSIGGVIVHRTIERPLTERLMWGTAAATRRTRHAREIPA